MHTEISDYYSLLNISRDASGDDIKKAYRTLAHQFHPDKNHGDANAEEKFKEISRAYEILSDPSRRLHYDRTGRGGYTDFRAPDGNMQHRGMGCGKKRGCGRGRSGGAWNFIKENFTIHEVAISREEAKNGADISVTIGTARGDSSYKISLPLDVVDGAVLRCSVENGSYDFFVRVVFAED